MAVGESGLKENGLPTVVLEDLITFGEVLGVSDVEDQKHLNLLRIRLNQALETAEAEQSKMQGCGSILGSAQEYSLLYCCSD